MKARVFCVLGAAFLFLQLGYGFESGDQQQYLLLPYRWIYPHFLPGDWLTWHTEHYHVTYAWLVSGLHTLAGESAFPYAMLAAHVSVLLALCASLLVLARVLGYGAWEPVFALLVFGVARATGIAGSVLNHGMLLPADLALPPFLMACASWAREQAPEQRTRQALVTGAWLGLSGFFHANFAVLGPMVLVPLEAERALRDRKPLRVLALLASYALVAAPTLVLIAQAFVAGDSAPDAIAITLFVRSPHHYDLRKIDPSDFLWPVLLALTALPTLAGLPRRAREHGARSRLLLAMSAITLLGVIGAGLRSLGIARLFAWRMSVPMLVLLLLAAGETLRLAFAQRATRRGPLVRALLCFVSALVVCAQPGGERRENRKGEAVAGLSERRLHLLDAKWKIDPPVPSWYVQARKLLPPDARVLAPPGMIEFRMQARRAMFVDWKCAPMKGDEALEWKRRMLAAMGTRRFPARGYRLRYEADRLYGERPLSELADLARREHQTHLVTPRSKLRERAPGLKRLLTGRDFVLYAVFPRPERRAGEPGGI